MRVGWGEAKTDISSGDCEATLDGRKEGKKEDENLLAVYLLTETPLVALHMQLEVKCDISADKNKVLSTPYGVGLVNPGDSKRIENGSENARTG